MSVNRGMANCLKSDALPPNQGVSNPWLADCAWMHQSLRKSSLINRVKLTSCCWHVGWPTTFIPVCVKRESETAFPVKFCQFVTSCRLGRLPLHYLQQGLARCIACLPHVADQPLCRSIPSRHSNFQWDVVDCFGAMRPQSQNVGPENPAPCLALKEWLGTDLCLLYPAHWRQSIASGWGFLL